MTVTATATAPEIPPSCDNEQDDELPKSERPIPGERKKTFLVCLGSGQSRTYSTAIVHAFMLVPRPESGCNSFPERMQGTRHFIASTRQDEALCQNQNRLFLASPHTWNGSFQYRFARVTSNGL